jgi:hypothetical protein
MCGFGEQFVTSEGAELIPAQIFPDIKVYERNWLRKTCRDYKRKV